MATKAEALLSAGRLTEAEVAAQAALAQSHNHWRVYTILGRIWFAQNRDKDAAEAFRHAVAVAPMFAPTHWRLAEFLMKKGDLEEAEAEVRRAIVLYPKEGSYHTTLGMVLMKRLQYNDARSSLRRAIRLNRRSPQPRIVLAQLLAERGKYRGAQRALTGALRRAPKFPQVLWALCNLSEDQGKVDQALAYARKILELDQTNAKIHIRIANLCKMAGRLHDAEMALRTALALQPLPATFQLLSEMMSGQSRRTEAIAAMMEACRLDPENLGYRTRLANLNARKDVSAAAAANKENAPIATQQVPNFSDRIRFLWRAFKNR